MTLSKGDEDELEATAIKSSNIGSGASISQADCGGNGSVIILIIIGGGYLGCSRGGNRDRDRGRGRGCS